VADRVLQVLTNAGALDRDKQIAELQAKAGEPTS
jgi:hypothetical protein